MLRTRSPILGNVALPLTLSWGLLLLLALAFGSFLNVCIARLPLHRSVVQPHSCCPRCSAPIRAMDNVPLLSWLLLRGCCRACRLPISIRYPLVEMAYAGLVAGSIFTLGFTPAALAAAVFCFLTLGLLVMDVETMRLPDAFTLPGAGLGLIAAAAPAAKAGLPAAFSAAGEHALTATAWAALMLAIRWTYYAVRRRHGLGAGDVKLVGMLAVWLSSANMALTFFFSVLSAALVGLALIFSAKIQRSSLDTGTSWRTRPLPFGAFLCGAALYAFFCGSPIITWYLHFFP